MSKKILIALIFCLSVSAITAAKVRYQPTMADRTAQIAAVFEKIKESCILPVVDKPVYSAELVSIAVPEQVAANQLFDVVITYRNTGNLPWFGTDTICPGQATTFLGTTRQLDRSSAIHAPALFGDTKWLGGNRIKMKSTRVNPGETAEFVFVAHAPQTEGIYREYFAPVIEGVTWMKDNAEATFDLKVGNPKEDETILTFTRDIKESLNLLDPAYFGEKKIHVDLSEQKMYLKTGDKVLKTFRVSTGAAKTPTPRGTYKIQFKQDVRVGGAWPHYIMPKFMQFKKGGYGIHALPSLANDRGVYWREALNHIGSPRSHGCIRLLPDDAELTYKFAEVGTEVKVVW